MQDLEVRQLSWEGAARKCIDIYDDAVLAGPRGRVDRTGSAQTGRDPEFAI